MGGLESIWAFGGVQYERRESSFVLIPIEYDLTSTYGGGARHGPRALLEASAHMELFDEDLGFSPTDAGVHTIEPIEQIAAGPEAMARRAADLVRGVLDERRVPVLIGGDHSLTIGAILALEESRADVTVVQLDAHADLREEYQGTPFSHACVMARARERFPCVQIGIRSMSEEEHERLRRDRFSIYPARRLRDEPDALLREIETVLTKRIYLTIDVDVLDPSIMPSTGTPEPGGLVWDEIVRLLRTITRGREVVGFDLMELSPIPGLRAPDFLAARLCNKVLGLVRKPRGVP